MAATLIKVPDSEDHWGKRRVEAGYMTFDTSYPLGGYPIDPATFGFKPGTLVVLVGPTTNALYFCQYNSVTGNLVVYNMTTGLEPVGVNLSAVTVYVLATGV